jgi:two-component system, NtrC family, nitrogen regulation sensor histidine kinase NtrY
MLAITLVPALVLLAVGGWAVATSLGLAGSLGPWEAVAETGRVVVELAEPDADPALTEALAAHRAELSSSLIQARRWAFLGERFRAVLPWLVIVVAAALIGLAAAASRSLARELARPIRELVGLADRLGRGEPLPPPAGRPIREVRVLDHALRDAAEQLAEAQRKALAAERLRMWGEMARRVAHEMKNPLTPLRLAAHRLERTRGHSGSAPAVAEAVEVITQEVARLEELAARFSTLGRPAEGPPMEVDVVDLLSSLLETDVPPGVDVVVDAPPDPPPVLGRYDALLRAFRNVIRNAVEAMEGTDSPSLDVGVHVAVGTRDAPGWMEIRIADTGDGLPVGSSERIFEPDFTTKTRGTGLGLALVRQAVEADGGTIIARNRERGAEFLVRLPLAGRPRATHPERTHHESPVR